MAKKRIYRISFHNQGKVYELHAGSVSHAEMMGFVEVGDLMFGERTNILVDPSEEKLRGEFAGVVRIFVPIHAVIRIDEVARSGTNKIVSTDGDNVAPFPVPMYSPGGDQGPAKS